MTILAVGAASKYGVIKSTLITLALGPSFLGKVFSALSWGWAAASAAGLQQQCSVALGVGFSHGLHDCAHETA